MRDLPVVELATEIDKARGKIWKMRFQARGEALENPGALKALRTDLARLLTVLNSKDGSSSRANTQAAKSTNHGDPSGSAELPDDDGTAGDGENS